MLSELSRLLKITIVGGSIPERSGDRLYNTCCVFGTDGKLKAKHRKVVFVGILSQDLIIKFFVLIFCAKKKICCYRIDWSGIC